LAILVRFWRVRISFLAVIKSRKPKGKFAYVYMYMERSDRAHTDADSYFVPRLNNLGTRPQEWSSQGTVNLTDCAQCMRMSSMNVGLDYDSMVMLTCKLLLFLPQLRL